MVRLPSGDFMGIEGRVVEVQVDVSARGSAGFSIVGLAGKSIRESRERVQTALRNSGFRFPHKHRIVVNLAPSAEQKDGAGFDLAVGLGILVASRQLRLAPGSLTSAGLIRGTGFLGELGLDGKLLPVPGALLIAHALRRHGVSRIVVAADSADEVGLVEGLAVFAASDIHEAMAPLQGRVEPGRHRAESVSRGRHRRVFSYSGPDFSEVRGQEATKRAILVVAAGGHNLLMTGPPGVGKTMLARRLPGILPPLEFSEAMEVTRISSVLGHDLSTGLIRTPPFRAPHHTISYAGLVGGGSRIRPGEVTRAHCGVLFLDELPEFTRRSLEALREPLEAGSITITRGNGSMRYPARFLLLAAMNPCPCGYLGHPTRACSCTVTETRAYRQRISGPLLDRIDLSVTVMPTKPGDLLVCSSEPHRSEAATSSACLRKRVLSARELQARRWGRPRLNARASLAALLEKGSIRSEALARLRGVAEARGLSARAFARCLRVARTVADLEACGDVEVRHLNEALYYRLPEG